MLEQAREYLARVVAWPAPGEHGFVNIHWTFKPSDGKLRPDGKFPWSGRAVKTLDEAMNALSFAMKNAGTMDVYACMSSQSVAEQKQGKNNWSYWKAVRQAANAISLKSFFLDIDVKPPQYDPHTGVLIPNQKGYPTFGEAVDALGTFIKATGLPAPSMIVNSGGGLHVYWVISRALTPTEWQPYSTALAEATKKLNLRCDTQCTVDSARVLRVPDTFNRKTEPPRAVRMVGTAGHDYSFERITACLEPYKNLAPTPRLAGALDTSIFPIRPPITGPNALASGVDLLGPLVDLDLVAPQCAFINNVLATGGAQIDNPLWNITTLISTFTKGQRADAHRMGNKHAGYTQESTDAFFDRKEREKEEKSLGWPSCATISANGCRACQNCGHFGKGKSPLNFEARTQPAAHQGPVGNAAPAQINTGFGTASVSAGGGAGQPPTGTQVSAAGAAPSNPPLNDLPPGFIRDARGIIQQLTINPDGSSSQTPVSDYPMTDPWIQGPKPYILRFNSVVERGKTTQIELPLEIVGGMEMRKYLQAQGFMMKLDPKKTQGFFLSWIETLQRQKDAVASSPFGWTRKGGTIEGFVFGGKLWTATGSSPAATSDGVISRQYEPCGGTQPWIDAAKLVVGHGRPDIEAIVASAFAAPLVAFTGHLGVIMSAFSQESGVGKSTALKIAQAVWGDPIKAVQSLSDTANSAMNKIGELRSLPIYWDELKTEEDTKKFVNITFQMGQGKEKSRLQSNAKQREPGSWQTLLVSCSNDSLLDYVTSHTNTTTAGLYRVFEYTAKKPAPGSSGQIDTSDATIILSKLNDNYGGIGLEYAKFLGANHQAVAKDIADFSRDCNKETSSNNEERFWIATIACICVGAAYANRLGFAAFDVLSLKAFMLGVLKKMRGEVSSQPVDMKNATHVSNVIAQFFNAMRQKHTLVTNRIHVAKGKPPANSIKIMHDATKLDFIAVHLGLDDKLLRISSSHLGDWLKERNVSRHIFIEALTNSFGMQKVVGRIGSGTVFAGATEYLLQIDISNHPELNFLDET